HDRCAALSDRVSLDSRLYHGGRAAGGIIVHAAEKGRSIGLLIVDSSRVPCFRGPRNSSRYVKVQAGPRKHPTQRVMRLINLKTNKWRLTLLLFDKCFSHALVPG